MEAYIELFREPTADTGMAFVVIPHLMPIQKSHLAEIVGRATRMPVREIVDGVRPRA